MRKLGASDLSVSACCLGGMTWGNQNSVDEAVAQLNMAFDFGVNFVDTAEAYPVPMSADSQGRTDECIAKWMAESKIPRDKVVISTKTCGYNERYTWFRDSGEGTRLSKSQIHESVDKSLKRLGIDHIDVLQFHWPERSVGLVRSAMDADVGSKDFLSAAAPLQPRKLGTEPISAQVEAIGELIASGKIRHWGLSNENAEGVGLFLDECAAQGVARPVCVQNAYSLLQRGDEKDLVELLQSSDVSYMPYSPLAGGVLSGKYSSKYVKKPAAGAKKKRSRLGLVKGYEKNFLESKGPDAVELYCTLARKFGVTPTQLAIALCNSRVFVTSTVIGATSLEQLAEDLQAFEVGWTQEMDDAVVEAYSQFPEPWRVQVAGMG